MRFFDVSSGFEQIAQGRCDEVDYGGEGVDVAVAAGACSGGLEQAVEALEAGVAVRGCPASQDAVAVGLDGGKRLAHRIEDRTGIEKVQGVAQEIGNSPASGLDRLRLANPAQLLLDAPSDGGEQVGSLEFGEGGDLRFGEPTVCPLQDGPAQRLGQLALPGFDPADLIDRLGEQLHDVEPIHGDGGVLEALADGGDERAAHVADHLGDTAGRAAMLGQECAEPGDGLLAAPMRAAASTGISRTRNKAACSNSSVKRLPSRAQGTVVRSTPCSEQSVRGTLAV